MTRWNYENDENEVDKKFATTKKEKNIFFSLLLFTRLFLYMRLLRGKYEIHFMEQRQIRLLVNSRLLNEIVEMEIEVEIEGARVM